MKRSNVSVTRSPANLGWMRTVMVMRLRLMPRPAPFFVTCMRRSKDHIRSVRPQSWSNWFDAGALLCCYAFVACRTPANRQQRNKRLALVRWMAIVHRRTSQGRMFLLEMCASQRDGVHPDDAVSFVRVSQVNNGCFRMRPSTNTRNSAANEPNIAVRARVSHACSCT